MIINRKAIRILTFIIATFYLSTNAQDSHIKYRINDDGYSFSINPLWDNTKKAIRMDHRSNNDLVFYDESFNRGIRRGNNILATGDIPRFALLKHLYQDKLDPDMIKMGDGMIAIIIGEQQHWLHLQKKIQVNFYPASTQYSITLDAHPEIKIQLLISVAKEWGAVAKLTITNTGGQQVKLNALMQFGGIMACRRTVNADYFSPVEKFDYTNNELQLKNEVAAISSKVIPEEISFTQLPSGTSAIENRNAKFLKDLILEASASETIYYIFNHSQQQRGEISKITPAMAESLIQECKEYYEAILNAYSISTPDKILNTGFSTAVLNFDNIYAPPAWMEGVHWWAAYWANNYQISAATSLGQTDRSKKALQFFNSKKYGPSPAMMLSGNPFVDSLRQGWEDGLPYYLFQLVQYYHHTGDAEFIKSIWAPIVNSIDKFYKLRDPDGNGLLNWHMGANAFMYQADNLGLPGDAASPSLIMAGMIDELSVIAKQLGYSKEEAAYKNFAKKIYQSLQKVLWNKKTGTFYSHKDLQQISHAPHYYTDFVFPALYTNLSNIYSWQSLSALYQTLWVKNYKGEKNLMKVGDLQPSLFGNDNVMPVQMAEAARAYFKLGDVEKGIKLLSSVALAGTIFTEAPGNFPERLSNEGKGEANYLFGNPIGAFIQTTVTGLFGIELVDNGKTMYWHPAFPENWNNAEIKLPYAKSFFKQTKSDELTEAVYKIEHDKLRTLLFSLFVNPSVIKNISCNGREIKYKLIPGIGKIQIEMNAPEAMSHEIKINYKPVETEVEGPIELKSGAKAKWVFGSAIDSLYDPQKNLKTFKVDKNSLTGNVDQNSKGHRLFFVKLKNISVLFPVEFSATQNVVAEKKQLIKPGANVKSTLIDISKYLTTDTVYSTTEWRFGNVVFDKPYFSEIDSASLPVLKEFGIVTPPIKMAMIKLGLSDSYTRETIKTRFPSRLTIPVNKKGQQLSLLMMNEIESRLTGATIGRLSLTYADGTVTQIPLTIGKNVDALSRFFATELLPVRMKFTDYIKIYNLPINGDKVLKSFTIKIDAADMQIGVMGVKVLGQQKH